MKKTIDLYGRFLNIYSEDSAGDFAENIYNSTNTSVVVRLNRDIFENIKDASDVDESLGKADLILCSHNDLGNEFSEDNSFYTKIFNLCDNDSAVIIGEDEEVIKKFSNYLEENFSGIHIKAIKVLDNSASVEAVVNMINDLVPKVVFTLLSSPLQEELICEHKYHMNVGFCIGFGEKPEFLGYSKGVLASIFKGKRYDVSKLIADLEIDG